MLLFLLPLFAALEAGPQELSPPLAEWKSQIEAKSGGPVIIVPVTHNKWDNTLTIPPETPRANLVGHYLTQEEFVRQFIATNALTVSQRENGAVVTIILLNTARKPQWQSEESIIAHELGHAWLKSEQYPAPRYLQGPTACLSTHTGDVVQHILLRQEMDRRGIVFRPAWIQDLQSELAALEKAPPGALQPCQKVQQAALWVDVRLGLTEKDWPDLARYEKVLRRSFPALLPVVNDLSAYLAKVDVRDKAHHREALGYVFNRLKLVGSGSEIASASLRR